MLAKYGSDLVIIFFHLQFIHGKLFLDDPYNSFFCDCLKIFSFALFWHKIVYVLLAPMQTNYKNNKPFEAELL